MENLEQQKALMWRFLDGDCSLEEQEQVRRQLANDPEWQSLWQETQMLHQHLQQINVAAPSPNFQQVILQKIALRSEANVLSTSLLSPAWKWGLAGGFTGFLLFATYQDAQWVGNSSLNFLSKTDLTGKLSAALEYLPPLSVILLVLCLGFLLLLDRWFLADYFQRSSLNRD